MEDKREINNIISICGEIASDFTYNHEVYGEKFYNVTVLSERKSGIADSIPVTVSERLIDVTKDMTGKFVSVCGQVRTFNKHEENNSKLIIMVFAKEIEILESCNYNNDLYLHGFICRHPVYRETPMGREITDILVAVNRPYGKSDYIPCILWGRNARYAGDFEIGTELALYGRIQSRIYRKIISDSEIEERTAYEASISRIVKLEGENESNN